MSTYDNNERQLLAYFYFYPIYMDTLKKFTEHLSHLEADALVSLYHDDIIFEDPAFGRLKGERVKDMWRLLLGRKKETQLEINVLDFESDGLTGTASWEAKYIFNVTGRKVHNKITSTFELKDGLIVKQDDKFDLYKWSKQAMGLTGTLVGWTKFFQHNLQGKTEYMLDTFIAKKEEVVS